MQVKASHSSGVLSSSFIFWCNTIDNISADFKCIVSYCRLCKNETSRQNLKLLKPNCTLTTVTIITKSPKDDSVWGHFVICSNNKPTFRPRPHESCYFWNLIFLHESVIRPQETSESAFRKGILLQPLSRVRFMNPLHTNQGKKIYILSLKNNHVGVDGTIL